MNRAALPPLKKWFAEYCRSFYSADEEDQRNFTLKELHTHNVCDNIVRIAGEESLGEEVRLLAEVTALFHDVGRFPQYQRYRTFKDSDSVNHAALGAKVLLDNRVLTDLPKEDQELIVQSVRLHNAFTIPGKLSPSGSLLLRMIRDADKLDIWRVFIDYYALPEGERASAVGLGLPDLSACSDKVIACLDKRQMVNLSMLNTLNDFKLLQLSWVYDLNFTASLRQLQERDYIGAIAATLPRSGRIDSLVAGLREFIDCKLVVGTDCCQR